MSMIENQEMIQEKGMDEFLKSQAEKYCCPSCGDVVSVHDGKCYACGYKGEKPLRELASLNGISIGGCPIENKLLFSAT